MEKLPMVFRLLPKPTFVPTCAASLITPSLALLNRQRLLTFLVMPAPRTSAVKAIWLASLITGGPKLK